MSRLLTSPSTSPIEISPETELAPLLAAWDLAHPTTTDPDWRHLLDELAHPRTTEAFHGLATSTT
ncbi:hypothetical protein ACGFWE_26100 [Streptomyces sp. NPDC048523]|uniref:hypothetical protein n=1 Tax=Streptomyces sp. NPDC048523 TaxID=3365567 RepID=UPI0037173128